MIERFGPVPRARHHRRDARRRPSASSTPPTSSSTTWRSGITWPGSARRCAARDPLVAAPHRARPRLLRRAPPRPADADRGAREPGGAALPRAGRARPLRALGHALRPPDHPAAARLSDSARDAVPGMTLPEHPGYPGGAERAAWHVEEAIRVFTRAFGIAPVGLLAVGRRDQRARRCELLAAGGFRWAASSAGVLRSSLRARRCQGVRRSALLQPPVPPPGGTGMNCFFRDDALSDLHRLHLRDLARRRRRVRTWRNELAQLARSYDGAREPRGADRARRRERLGALPLQRLLLPARAVRAARRASAARADDAVRLPGARPRSRRRCRRSAPAAGCTARSPPGWETRPRTAAGTCCVRAKEAYDRVDARHDGLDERNAPPPIGNWRCARARTGSGGSATTTRPMP